MVSITSGTTSVANMFDRKANTRYISSGNNNDLTATVLRFEFNASENINRIVLDNINWKSFKIYYNSNTANVLTLLNGPTNSSTWITNSLTTMYLEFATISASRVTIAATTTMVANAEKYIYNIWFLEKIFTLVDNPSAQNYDPNLGKTIYKHEMSDGGNAVYYIGEMFRGSVKLDWITNTYYDFIKGISDLEDTFVFVPFPTGTGWDGNIWQVNYVNDFDFMQYSSNYKGNGYSGTIKMEEAAK
jgi:hypothetical protein